MSEMSEKNENLQDVNEENITSEETQPEAPKDTVSGGEPIKPKKKKSTGKKILIALGIILALLLLLIGGAIFAADRYVDHMLGYISYEESEEEWSGVDIDDPSFGVDQNIGGDYSGFVDPEAGTDTDPNYSAPDVSVDVSIPDDTTNPGNPGNTTPGKPSNPGNTAPQKPAEVYKPDYTIIEGLFDGDNVSDEYEKEVVNILLIGADTISGSSARSDTMIIMSINNLKKRITFTSIMRDTFVSIPGRKDNRINAAYAAGGPNLLMRTIKQNFDIEIDYYFVVSLSSFKQAVNAIGGMDITINSDNYNYFYKSSQLAGLTEAQATDGTHTIHLNGDQALAYARSRNFRDGDFTRTLHQRDILKQFALQCKGKSLTELHNLLKTVLPFVKTNMPKKTLKSMIWNVLTYISYSITDARVPCPGSFKYANITGREVLVINFDTNKKYLKAKIYG